MADRVQLQAEAAQGMKDVVHLGRESHFWSNAGRPIWPSLMICQPTLPADMIFTKVSKRTTFEDRSTWKHVLGWSN